MAELVIATRSGKILVIDENDLPSEGREGRGARIAGVRPGDTITAVARVYTNVEVAEVAETVHEREHAAVADADVPDDRRQAIIDVIATRMPQLREHGGRTWVESSARTLAEMATDELLIDLVERRNKVNTKLAEIEQRTTENFNEREALDTRIANRVVHLFRTAM
jgi:hypothetical protein